VRGIEELGREEELGGAGDVLEQFRSEIFGKKILTRRVRLGAREQRSNEREWRW
jgi:hypothetical protein